MHFLLDHVATKDALFFLGLAEELEARGHSVVVTTRNLPRLNQLQEYFYKKFLVLKFESHEETLKEKLRSSLKRSLSLSELHPPPDRVICLCSPEACRLGFGLNIPVYNFCDIPEAVHVCKLTIPLSSKLFVPEIVTKAPFLRYGIDSGDIVEYPCLDPVAWLKNYKINFRVLDDLGLQEEDPIIVFTPSEYKAAYLLGKRDMVIESIKKLVLKYPSTQFIGIPRYNAEQFKTSLPRQVKVMYNIFDLPSLLAFSDLFIGGGGTINIEAAYFGVPVIACRPIPTIYEAALCDAGLSWRATSIGEILRLTARLLGASLSKKAERYFHTQKFPVKEIVDVLTEE